MTLARFLKALALYNVVLLGLVWIAAPQAGLGAEPDPYATMIARALGTNLVVIGVMNWLVSSQPIPLMRKFLWPNLATHLVPAAISTANILAGTFPARNWIGVVIHLIPAVALIAYAVRPPS
ncbi:hypothetical protein AB0M02_17805 [Actinoplanes sp. NPDC051861]|uniref:hypothetical protein n=1 Tax=Actinoplanes sp. NPDC051861 TaxID=3155170 RepID=UPI00343703F4